MFEKQEVGSLGLWSATSCKPGFGVELLRDGKTDTFWQSDAAPPHSIYIIFPRRMTLCELQIYIDHRMDESYTPQILKILSGFHYGNLHEIARVSWQQPCGWISIPLYDHGIDLYTSSEENDKKSFLETFMLQIMIVSNQQMGRDSHVRLINIYGPKQYVFNPSITKGKNSSFHSIEKSMISLVFLKD
jgi:anaphase-promoting complex subunit 10